MKKGRVFKLLGKRKPRRPYGNSRGIHSEGLAGCDLDDLELEDDAVLLGVSLDAYLGAVLLFTKQVVCLDFDCVAQLDDVVACRLQPARSTPVHGLEAASVLVGGSANHLFDQSVNQ